MKRTDADLNVANQFADGDPLVPTAGTLLDASWLNNVQEELCNAVESDGSTLSGSDHTQLRNSLALLLGEPGGRLSLTTALPVTTGDVSAATTVYYSPHRHNRISLYNGTVWKFYTFSELSQLTTNTTKSPAAVANNSNYDVFVWDDSGTLRATRGPAWSSSTARGTGAGTTELVAQDGRLVNKVAITNGPGAGCGLYVGTIRSNGTATIDDSEAKRHVWNRFNRVYRHMRRADDNGGGGAWTYSTAAWRQANGSVLNQLSLVRGLNEDSMTAEIQVLYSNSTSTLRISYVAVGLDGTSPVDTTSTTLCETGGTHITVRANYSGVPGLGAHTLTWLEYGNGSDTQSWGADNVGTPVNDSNIHATLMA